MPKLDKISPLRIKGRLFQILWSSLNTWTLKFIYSENATEFCKIYTLFLSSVVPVKSKVEISQNCLAFSEYMYFNRSLKTNLVYSRFGLGYCSSCRSRSFEQAVIEKGQKFPKKVKCGSKCLAKAHWFNFFSIPYISLDGISDSLLAFLANRSFGGISTERNPQ